MRIFIGRKKIKRSYFLFICGLILVSVFVFHIPAVESSEKTDQIEILVIGSGSIIDGNIAAAREDAISDAFLKGVEQYLAKYLGGQRMINNFPRLINEVIPGAKDEIENFNILAEEKSNNRYRILVRMKVNESLMEEKLNQKGIIFKDIPPIKFLFLVSQKDSRDENISYWWNKPDSNNPLTSTELILYRVFQECGFDPVNRLSSVPEEKYSDDIRKLDLTDEDAMEWGRLYSSDVVIVGKSEITENEMVFISVKSIDVKEKSVINEDFQTEQINQYGTEREQVMDALARAINSIVTRLSPAIISSFEAIEEVNLIEVELRGLRSLEQLINFSDFLKKDIEGVKSVMEKRIKVNSINLAVEFSGEEDAFFDRVRGHEKFPFFADLSQKEGGGFVIELH